MFFCNSYIYFYKIGNRFNWNSNGHYYHIIYSNQCYICSHKCNLSYMYIIVYEGEYGILLLRRKSLIYNIHTQHMSCIIPLFWIYAPAYIFFLDSIHIYIVYMYYVYMYCTHYVHKEWYIYIHKGKSIYIYV